MRDGLNLAELGVSPRATFACYAMQTSVSRDLSEPVRVTPGAFALFGTPFKVDELWTQSLGTFHDEQLAESNLLLIAFDDELPEPQLARQLGMIWYALLLQGRAYSVDGLKLGGYNTQDGLHVSAGGSLDDFYRPPQALPSSVDFDSLRRCADIAEGITTIFRREDDQHFLRLRKGFNALLRGMKEGTDADFRLHQFVRAVEAVMKPDRGGTTGQFVHRGQLFAGRKDKDRALLRQLFEMRSASEHLNTMKDVLVEPDAHTRKNVIWLRVFQAEILASHIYSRLLTERDLLQNFGTDDDISAIWKRSDDKLIELWGPPVDLERAVERKFEFLRRTDRG
jgi:hypothetical protein